MRRGEKLPSIVKSSTSRVEKRMLCLEAWRARPHELVRRNVLADLSCPSLELWILKFVSCIWTFSTTLIPIKIRRWCKKNSSQWGDQYPSRDSSQDIMGCASSAPLVQQGLDKAKNLVSHEKETVEAKAKEMAESAEGTAHNMMDSVAHAKDEAVEKVQGKFLHCLKSQQALESLIQWIKLRFCRNTKITL